MPETPKPYSVIEVHREWLRVPDSVNLEEMGSKYKFWFRQSNIQKKWLFKYPTRRDSGEHWAEKIAAEVARLLDVSHPRVELATFGETPGELATLVGYRGSVSESFTEGNDRLIHGNELLPLVLPDYDTRAVRFRQPYHTLDNIWSALDKVFETPAEVEAAKRRFSEYLTLDALIGNTDRHHENWGLLTRYSGSGLRISVSPSFDHASSLGHELQDRRRSLLLSQRRIQEYAIGVGKRGSGGIYWSSDDAYAPSPLQLVIRAVEAYPSLFDSSMTRLQKLNEDSLREVVENIPPDWMTRTARDFAIALMCYNFNKLSEIFR